MVLRRDSKACCQGSVSHALTDLQGAYLERSVLINGFQSAMPSCITTLGRYNLLLLSAADFMLAGSELDPGPEVLTGNVTWGDKALEVANQGSY